MVFVTPEDEAGADGVRVRRDDAASYAAAFAEIRREHGGVQAVLYLWATESVAAVGDAVPIVLTLQAVAASQMKPRRVILAAPCGEGVERSHADSWIGFERSVGMVLAGTVVTPLYVSGPVTTSDWAALVAAELGATQGQAALYRDGVRHELQVRPAPLVAGETLLKQGGVYLITGGLGGLGLLLARHLAVAWEARLVLTGRSALDAHVREKLASLGEERALYVPADVADAAAMVEVVRLCRERFGRLDGVIYAAGLEGRGSLLEADVAEFAAVLAPKVAGTLALEAALVGEALDFVCHFSSSSAILGDFGSCAYAVANRFQMARAAAAAQPRTIAINWPLWAEGGMGLGSAPALALYLKSSGQEALATAEGLALFERLLNQPGSQRLVLRGRPGRVRRFLGLEQAPSAPVPVAALVPSADGRRVEMRGLSVAECVVWDLKEQASRILKVRREHLTVDDNLAEFGFDSIGLAEFAAVLGGHWGVALTPSVFFAHPTLERLCSYLLAEHTAVLEAFYSAETQVSGTPQPTRPAKARAVVRHASPALRSEPIAIIGMSALSAVAQRRGDVDDPGGGPRGSGFGAGGARGRLGGDELPCGVRAGGVGVRAAVLRDLAARGGGDGPAAAAAAAGSMGRAGRCRLWAAADPRQPHGHVRRRRGRRLRLSQPRSGQRPRHRRRHSQSHRHPCLASGIRPELRWSCDGAQHGVFVGIGGGSPGVPEPAGGGVRHGGGSRGQPVADARSSSSNGSGGHAVAGRPMPRIRSARRRHGAGRSHCGGGAEAAVAGASRRRSDPCGDRRQRHQLRRPDQRHHRAERDSSQAVLLNSVYDGYGIDPNSIELVVAHGTGTALGDPIEANALIEAFGSYTAQAGGCALISTKGNFGHSLAASGVVSLIVLVQALRHQTMPASLHCEAQSDYVRWAESPFTVNRSARAWPRQVTGRRIGAVSAFGISGTNAHVVVREADCVDEPTEVMPCYLLALSAKSEAALLARIAALAALLERVAAPDLARVSHTLLADGIILPIAVQWWWRDTRTRFMCWVRRAARSACPICSATP